MSEHLRVRIRTTANGFFGELSNENDPYGMGGSIVVVDEYVATSREDFREIMAEQILQRLDSMIDHLVSEHTSAKAK